MRRRQAYALDGGEMRQNGGKIRQNPANRQDAAGDAARKGHCPKCGQHIGRGVAFHAKSCKG